MPQARMFPTRRKAVEWGGRMVEQGSDWAKVFPNFGEGELDRRAWHS